MRVFSLSRKDFRTHCTNTALRVKKIWLKIRSRRFGCPAAVGWNFFLRRQYSKKIWFESRVVLPVPDRPRSRQEVRYFLT